MVVKSGDRMMPVIMAKRNPSTPRIPKRTPMTPKTIEVMRSTVSRIFTTLLNESSWLTRSFLKLVTVVTVDLRLSFKVLVIFLIASRSKLKFCVKVFALI